MNELSARQITLKGLQQDYIEAAAAWNVINDEQNAQMRAISADLPKYEYLSRRSSIREIFAEQDYDARKRRSAAADALLTFVVAEIAGEYPEEGARLKQVHRDAMGLMDLPAIKAYEALLDLALRLDFSH